MQNVLNVILLLSSVFTCLALGLAAAYGLCNVIFSAMRPRAAQPVPAVKAIVKPAGIATL